MSKEKTKPKAKSSGGMRRAVKKWAASSSSAKAANEEGEAPEEEKELGEETKAAGEGEADGEGDEEAAEGGESNDEPTAEQLAVVEKEIAEEAERALPAAARDVLSGYMEQLSHIPLFTPDNERKAAEALVNMEVSLWEKLLRQPMTYDVLSEASLTMEKSVQEQIAELKKSTKRINQRTSDRTTKIDRSIDDLAMQLRYIDNDKEVMEQIVTRLRRSAWTNTKGKHADPAAKVPFKEMLSIERSRGEALRARNDFVRANLRLVVSVARSFHHVRLPLIDLIQEGNVGLMKAVHRYDHRRGFRFSTYAIWWIRQAIERAIINKGSAVRLPVHVIDSRRQVSRASNKLTQKLGRAPSTAELSKTLHMSQTKLNQILAGVHQDPVSLDDPISSDDPRNYLDMVRDENTPALDESLIRENTRERIRELLGLLSPIEKDIIRRRFGMHDGQDQTLDEIGKHYNLSRERVRQIQTQGLMKMRRMCERRKIGTR